LDQPRIEPTDDSLAFSSLKRLPEENKSKVVLVVDDDAETIALVASIGRKAGYTVFSAASGEECLSMLWRVTPELIMLDVKMPGLDGYETCRRIRSDPNVAHVPIAFLTARKTVDDVKRGVSVGGDDFIVKPFDGTQLVDRIELLVSRGHMLSTTRSRRSSKVGVPEEDQEGTAATKAIAASKKGRNIRMISTATGRGATVIEISSDPKAGTRVARSLASRVERCSLRQIAAQPLTPFLAHEAHHNAPGQISTSVLPMWWDALMAIAHEQLNTIQGDLDRLLPLDDVMGLAALSQTLRGVIAMLTSRLAEMLLDPKLSSAPAVKALARVSAAAEMKLISEILLVAGPLEEAMGVFDRGISREMNGKAAIADLSPTLVGEAKKCYTKLGEGGVAGRLFVIAILNRLEKPWQIFRLTRALSWNRDASVVSGTELRVIGDRLLFDLSYIATAVDTVIAKTRTRAWPIDFDAILKLVARYCDAGEGLLSEIDIKRDSPWGEALLSARGKMCRALEEERLGGIADAILGPVPEKPNSAWTVGGAHPDETSIRQAERAMSNAAMAIRFLTYVAQRGDKHGFGNPARRVLETLRATVTDRVDAALEERQVNPSGGATPAYLDQAIKLVELLLKDQRGQALGNRLKAALQGC
jgi:DNA-binding response OmpR family regulator